MGILYFSGAILFCLAILVGAIALFIFGPVYLAISSTKRKKKMAELSPLKRKVHRVLHWAAGLTIAGLVLYILVGATFIEMTQR